MLRARRVQDGGDDRAQVMPVRLQRRVDTIGKTVQRVFSLLRLGGDEDGDYGRAPAPSVEVLQVEGVIVRLVDRV